MKNALRSPREAVIALLSLALAGCWTPPNANVAPKVQSGLIEDGIQVSSILPTATVQSIDLAEQRLVLELPDRTVIHCGIDRQLEHIDQIKAGDQVRAELTKELAIFGLPDHRLPGAREIMASDARVLTVDPSYRLLTVQYSGGLIETYKVGLEARLKKMEPGDDVVVRFQKVRSLKVFVR